MSVLDIPAGLQEKVKNLKAISPQQIVDQGVKKTMGQIAKVNGLILGALAMYFAQLGAAAFKGFVIGATIGGTAGAGFGAYMGLQIALATGPFAPLTALVTVPLGAAGGGFAGAIVGGLAGGLIAAGIYSGSATMVSMGVGAGIGGVVGGYIGFVVGSAIAGGFVALAAAACAATLIGCVLVPVAAVSSPAIIFASTAIGSVVGAFTGAAAGYLVGKYVLSPVQNAFTEGLAVTKGGFKVVTGGPIEVGGGIFSAGAGFVSAVGNTIAAAATTIWNVGAGLAGGAFSGLASGLNFVVGGLTSVGLPASAVMIPVVGGVGTIAVGGIIVGSIITPASFFSPQQDFVIGGTGDNDAYKIEKSASPTSIPDNDDLPEEISYTIKLTAKATLGSISISDNLQVNGENGNFTINTINGKSILENCSTAPPAQLTGGQSWTCEFKMTAENKDGKNFNDSVVTNIVTVTAGQQGSAPVTDTAFSVTTVGKPPVGCPSGWPLEHGSISQGPLGPTSHARLWDLFRESAIDIGSNPRGTPTFTTFAGKVKWVQIDPIGIGGYGTYVDIEAVCDGTTFKARWAHLNSVDSAIKIGSDVSFGQLIGGIDETGFNIGGDHLHYSLFGLEIQNYIPKPPATLSCELADCGVSW